MSQHRADRDIECSAVDASKYLGRAGGLAAALAVAAALSSPATSWAEPTDSGSGDSSSSGASASQASDSETSRSDEDTSSVRDADTAQGSATSEEVSSTADLSDDDAPTLESGDLSVDTPAQGETVDSLDEASGALDADAADAADADAGYVAASDDSEAGADGAAVGQDGGTVPRRTSRSLAVADPLGTDDDVLGMSDAGQRAGSALDTPAVESPAELNTAGELAIASPSSAVTTVESGAALVDVVRMPEDVPSAPVPVATALVNPLLLPGAPGDPATPSPAPLVLVAGLRREDEQSSVNRDSGAAQVGIAAAAPVTPGPVAAATAVSEPLSIFDAMQQWFQRTFYAASPTFSPQAVPVSIEPGASSQLFELGAQDADTVTLKYTIAGKATGTGTAAGTLSITGESATYTPPVGWDGATAYADSFTVTVSDDDGGFHIHGISGLLHLLTFGLVGDPGHTATSTVTVNVAAVPKPPEVPVEPEPEPAPEPEVPVEPAPEPEPAPPVEPEAPPVVVGTFPVSFANNTGVYSDDEIHMMVIGQASPGLWSWVDRDGVAHGIDHAAADAPGHLVKDGVNYADMSFTLAEAGNLRIPTELLGARIYVSLGEPVYIGISGDNSGWVGPDPANPADPNYQTIYDWYELSFKNGSVPFGGNTTQVDQFSFPFTFTLTQDSSGFSGTRGITLSREEVFQRFADTMPAAFQALVVNDGDGNPLRILAPRSQQPGALASWFDEPVNDFWGKYAGEQFVYNGPGFTVTGGVDGNDRFAYTVGSAAGASTSYVMTKPTTAEVFRADGPFVGAGLQGAFLAHLDAAFHRGVATSPQDWDNAAAYYPAGGRWNNWAQFFHANSVEGYAYGFPYDDVNSQSSVLILNNPQPLTNLNLTFTG